MAFSETRAQRTVKSGVCPVEITLSETVYAGDCLGITGGTWVLSAHASGEQPILVAGVAGVSGERIQAYPMAIVSVTISGATTVGEVVCLNDSGEYVVDTAEYPDVGWSISSDTLCICPTAAQLTDKRA